MMKSVLLLLIITIFFLFINSVLSAQDSAPKTGVYLEEVFSYNGKTLNYRILYPDGFDENKKYPLVLFLHGAGERGDNNQTQLVHGSKLWIANSKKYPAIVIFPQCPKEDFWAKISRPGGKGSFKFSEAGPPTKALQSTIKLAETFLEKDFVDQDRFYVGGLSMGGMGTFELAWRMSDKIAAAFPICGGGASSNATVMKNIPFWIFHGVVDDVVPARYSMQMLRAIQGADGKAKISLYPNVNHNSWDKAFAEPDLLPWVFSKKLK